MTVLPGEVAGLPDGGPAVLARVKLFLKIEQSDVTEDDDIDLIIEGVNDVVRTWPVAELSVDQETWRKSTELGASMLAARLYRRKNSPDGIAGFADGAPIYVRRNDPDIAMLLKLDTWAGPVVG